MKKLQIYWGPHVVAENSLSLSQIYRVSSAGADVYWVCDLGNVTLLSESCGLASSYWLGEPTFSLSFTNFAFELEVVLLPL